MLYLKCWYFLHDEIFVSILILKNIASKYDLFWLLIFFGTPFNFMPEVSASLASLVPALLLSLYIPVPLYRLWTFWKQWWSLSIFEAPGTALAFCKCAMNTYWKQITYICMFLNPMCSLKYYCSWVYLVSNLIFKTRKDSHPIFLTFRDSTNSNISFENSVCYGITLNPHWFLLLEKIVNFSLIALPFFFQYFASFSSDLIEF